MTLSTNTAQEEAAWLDVAAAGKAASIMALAPPEICTVAEVGCGSGAVIRALDERGFAHRYWACEPSRDLFDLIPCADIGRLVSAEPVHFADAFRGLTFDLVILSHVLEHLLSPAVLLHEALLRSKFVILEVPIENNVAGWLRSQLKRARGIDRLDNRAGHVQFFARRTARALVSHAGGKVIASRAYFPVEPYSVQADTVFRKAVLASAGAGPLVRRYYEHYTLLTTRADEVPRHTHYAVAT